MNKKHTILANDWESIIKELILFNSVYAPTQLNTHHDYELISVDNIRNIIYNRAKPVTPLKSFFLPIKENITNSQKLEKRRIIIGAPNCDLAALGILDEIYLDEEYIDPGYKEKRNNTLIITGDCFETQEHCHCTTYGFTPHSDDNFDLSLAKFNELFIITTASEKGKKFIDEIKSDSNIRNTDQETIDAIERKHKEIVDTLNKINSKLPDYLKTGELLRKSEDRIWDKYSENCVSCGACATICPTCSCFLLIDKPNFEKVRQMDACQYPGFERVACDEDPLHKKSKRFKNRYFCKYVWKPEKFKSLACTGCGRCIETCIGKINKNELFEEIAN